MPGKTGFDFNGSSQAFNVLAAYLFGKVHEALLCFCPRKKLLWITLKLNLNLNPTSLFLQNITSEQMEMTTPVYTRKSQSDGVKMDMTTPVITNKASSSVIQFSLCSICFFLHVSLDFTVWKVID